ncbi:ATP-binding protein [Candidatus Pacearchaeota archaeon]|nr:ATP-binding protein [Candidatus Pacearchaeota archaeon]
MEYKKELTRIAITGGPGTGKSTVLELLSKKGYAIVPEAGRILITENQNKNIDSSKKRASQEFQNKISKLQFKLENNFKEGIVFSDRGIVDGYVYSKLNQLKVPNIITKHGKNRYFLVFILDSLPVYKNDQVRLRDEKTARKIHADLRKAYLHFGYTPISVPVLPPNERVEFILAKLNSFN